MNTSVWDYCLNKLCVTKRSNDAIIWDIHIGITSKAVIKAKFCQHFQLNGHLPSNLCHEKLHKCMNHHMYVLLSVSLLSPVLFHSRGWLGLGIHACRCVFMSRCCALARSSEGCEKSPSLSNIAGLAGNALRLSPVTSPYGSPCPLRRSRSPIPSVLWGPAQSEACLPSEHHPPTPPPPLPHTKTPDRSQLHRR